jgi:hypothetical protein
VHFNSALMSVPMLLQHYNNTYAFRFLLFINSCRLNILLLLLYFAPTRESRDGMFEFHTSANTFLIQLAKYSSKTLLCNLILDLKSGYSIRLSINESIQDSISIIHSKSDFRLSSLHGKAAKIRESGTCDGNKRE